MNNNSVYINKIAKFLPGNPVNNDEIEEYLGYINGKKSRSKSIVLRNNQITKRYYAIDKQGNSTYSNAQMAAEAVKGLCSENFKLEELELLTCGTAS
ncbi:MAG: hypothetical protein NTX97_08660, partial [Bacteroidetes bacterium]|nr:hypothetical protein [Bacteroidota bacterium]